MVAAGEGRDGNPGVPEDGCGKFVDAGTERDGAADREYGLCGVCGVQQDDGAWGVRVQGVTGGVRLHKKEKTMNRKQELPQIYTDSVIIIH